MKVILIGKARSGKSTASAFISERYTCKEFALADLLKQLLFKVFKYFNMPIEDVRDFYDCDRKELYRKYMQYFGTEIFRTVFGENFWCEQLDKLLPKDNWIVSDVRFENELKYFMEKFEDLKIIYINRENLQKSTHSSEQSERILKNHKNISVVENTNSLEDLYKQLISLLE